MKIKINGIEHKKVYAMIFKEFCPRHMQNRIKEHPGYDSIINNPLKLINEIAQSMHEPLRATYLYLSLTESLARITNTRQQDKERLLEYTDRFKQ